MKLVLFVILSAFCAFAQNAVVNPNQPTPVVAPAAAAKQAPYGTHLGSVNGSFGAGLMLANGEPGAHPALTGDLEVGVHKYLAVFGTGGYSHVGRSATACYYGYCATAHGSTHYFDMGGGLKVVGTNRSRFVPYGKFGMAYVGGASHASVSSLYYSDSISDYGSAPAVLFGGGLRTYVNHRFGVDFAVTGMRTVGSSGGATIVSPTVGVFFQSK